MEPGTSTVECIDSFHAFDESGHAFDVEEWADVHYSSSESGRQIRSVGKKHLRMAGSGSLVHSHLDGSLEDSATGLRLRMNYNGIITGMSNPELKQAPRAPDVGPSG
jgi:hypothetical protein